MLIDLCGVLAISLRPPCMYSGSVWYVCSNAVKLRSHVCGHVDAGLPGEGPNSSREPAPTAGIELH